MNIPETKVVKVPLYYIDERTKLKKYCFVMRCVDCTIYQNKYAKDCERRGACKFCELYDSFNKEYSERQRRRTLEIMMSGYLNPRG